MTSAASDAALDTLTESGSYVANAKVALHLDDTNLVLGGKTLGSNIDAILVENGHNTSQGAELALEMDAAGARSIWNAQFNYTDPTATRVNPTFNGSHNKVLVSGLKPGSEVYKLTGSVTGNKLGF